MVAVLAYYFLFVFISIFFGLLVFKFINFIIDFVFNLTLKMSKR